MLNVPESGQKDSSCLRKLCSRRKLEVYLECDEIRTFLRSKSDRLDDAYIELPESVDLDSILFL